MRDDLKRFFEPSGVAAILGGGLVAGSAFCVVMAWISVLEGDYSSAFKALLYPAPLWGMLVAWFFVWREWFQ